MFVAYDVNNNRIYADAPERYKECYCPACKELVTHKRGHCLTYFSHKPGTDCRVSRDKDYKSEWHLRMQAYFPRENLEVSFKDEITGEKHIADVFLPESNTVLEFQHSPIDQDEFVSRTEFHLDHGRRIVWLFDKSSESKDVNRYGKFKYDDCSFEQFPYENRSYLWPRNPRKILNNGPNIVQWVDRYSICVYTGTEGDIFHRIVKEKHDFGEVTLSIHDIVMDQDMNTEDFFIPDSYWITQEPWRTKVDEIRRMQAAAKEKYHKQLQAQIRQNVKAYKRGWHL